MPRSTRVTPGAAEDMADVFISYSRDDGDFARELHAFLTDAGKDVWIDWEDIPPASQWLLASCIGRSLLASAGLLQQRGRSLRMHISLRWQSNPTPSGSQPTAITPGFPACVGGIPWLENHSSRRQATS